MADTLGGLIDKLITIDMKMWNNQEFLYKVRKMDFKEFEKTFASSSDTKLSLFNSMSQAFSARTSGWICLLLYE